MILWILLGTGFVVLAAVLVVFPMMLSGRISQQEREAYRRQHGRWPEW